MLNKKNKLIVSAIISAAVILAITSVWNDSVIVDEVPHVGAGYSYLTKGDYRLNPEHPPLAKDLAAIPLLFLNIDKNSLFGTQYWNKDINGQWDFGRFLIFKASSDPQKTSRMAKLPVLLFYILSAILIFKWIFKIYGRFPAYTALILFLFSPTIMAHARFVTTDLAALFGILFSTYFFIEYLKNPNKKTFWLASVFFGIALVSKFSTFLLIPFLGILSLVYAWTNSDNKFFIKKIKELIMAGFKSLAIFILGFIIVVWPVYYFHTYNYPAERQKNDTADILKSFGNKYLKSPVVWASDKPVLRSAAQYGLGLLMVVQRSAGGNTIYFQGEVLNTAGKKYFPTVYLIKEPLAWWGLVIIALGIIITKTKTLKLKTKNLGIWIKDHFTEFSMLLWLVIYWATSIRSTLNIGVRHLLPTYPFAIMLVSSQIGFLANKLKNKKHNLFTLYFLLCTLLGWYVFENINIYPYYLTYFNQLAGGPSNGYKIAVDSNIDWGQDLKRLSDWVEKNNIPKISLDYFGWADQDWYLRDKIKWVSSKTYTDLEDFKLKNETDGWIAVSATFLMGSRGGKEGNYGWLREQTPITVIGNSIFVYYLK